MKAFFLAIISIAFLQTSCVSQYHKRIQSEARGLVFTGILTEKLIEEEPSFTWFAENQKNYNPDKGVVEVLTEKKDKFSLMIFMATWCADSKYILPKLLKTLHTVGFNMDKIAMLAADENKKVEGGLTEVFGVTNIPTIIVLHNGKEIGRVVEYGESGLWDVEIADIVKTIP